jgi:hypothetical protein
VKPGGVFVSVLGAPLNAEKYPSSYAGVRKAECEHMNSDKRGQGWLDWQNRRHLLNVRWTCQPVL